MNNYHRFLNLPFSVKNPTILKITDNIDGQVEECAYGLSECQNRCEFGSITLCYKNTFFESLKEDLKDNAKNVKNFLDKFGLFFDNPLYFWTKANDKLHMHVDNNKEFSYYDGTNDLKDFFDNHVKINFTWGSSDSKMQWWHCDEKDIKISDKKDKNGDVWVTPFANEEDCNLVFEETISRPSLVNGGTLHSVINPSKTKNRLTQSFNIVSKSNFESIKFNEACEIFKEYVL